MATGTAISLDEYLQTGYRPDREYVDGEVRERNVGEWEHSRLLSLLSSRLGNREKQWGVLVSIALRLRV
ncbi:MAG TPA: hypothetical protein VNH18_19510, partial [Bryobacteraceae bacterium]|nr:hypothetical protein [Bryobacteraceae bacterium]